MTDPIPCPVCGRDMVFDGAEWWKCCGESYEDHFYSGPAHDRDGSKVRAQIAEIERRVLERKPVDADCESPKTCQTCVFKSPVTQRCQSNMSQWKHYSMPNDGTCQCWSDRAAPTAYVDQPASITCELPAASERDSLRIQLEMHALISERNGMVADNQRSAFLEIEPRFGLGEFESIAAQFSQLIIKLACPAFVTAVKEEKK